MTRRGARDSWARAPAMALTCIALAARAAGQQVVVRATDHCSSVVHGQDVTRADDHYLWWLKLFAAIGLLSVVWSLASMLAYVKDGSSPRSSITSAKQSTRDALVQSPVTYHVTPSTARFQLLPDHSWGAW